jgi:hypothetical protein
MTTDDLLRLAFEAAAAARRANAPTTACLRAMTGRWVALQAQPLDRHGDRVIATFAPATFHTLLPAYAAWNGLTAHEAQLLEMTAGGEPTKTLARTPGHLALHRRGPPALDLLQDPHPRP